MGILGLRALIIVAAAGALLSALAGCANHPLDCSLGISHHDCLPGTAGYERVAARERASDNQCLSYGLRFGTAEYAQCRQNIDAQRGARDAAVLGAAISRTNPPAQASPMPPVRQPSQTSCVTNGQYTNCQTQ